MSGSAWLLGTAGLGAADFAALFGHFALLSLLAVGGAIATAPDMHRWLVGERGWIADAQFSASIALAQAAPGPNVLFVAVIGFNVGGLVGALAALSGSLLPSTLLARSAGRYGRRHAESLPVQAFQAGMAPLVIGLVAATGWLVAEPVRGSAGGLVLIALTLLLMLRTQAGPLLPIAIGAVAGALGWV